MKASINACFNFFFFICFKIPSTIIACRSKFPQEISTKCFIKSYKIITIDEWNGVCLIGTYDVCFNHSRQRYIIQCFTLFLYASENWRMIVVQHLTVHQIDLIQSGGNNYNKEKEKKIFISEFIVGHKDTHVRACNVCFQ